MKVFVRNFTFFLLLFVVGYFLTVSFVAFSTRFSPALEKNINNFGVSSEYGSTNQRSADLKTWLKSAKTSKGLILGSSTAYRNINPFILDSLTGFNWFNVGSSAQTPDLSFLLLKYCAENTSVKYIILDLCSNVFENTTDECTQDWIRNGLKINDLKTTIVKEHIFDLQLVHQYIYRAIKEMVGGRFYTENDRINGSYLGNGFVCGNGFQPLTSYTNKTYFSYSSDFGRSRVQKIIDYCKQKGITLIINQAPVLGESNDIDKVFAANNLIINADFNSPANFYDEHHMTCEGSTLYTKQLAPKIKQLLATAR